MTGPHISDSSAIPCSAAAPEPALSSPRTVPSLHGLRTFVLNLRRREDRRNHVESLCRALGLNYEIVEALDGTALQAREGAKAEHLQGCEFRMSWPCDSSQDPPWAIGVAQNTTEGALTW